jgi:WD40 repeat protein
LEVIWNSRHHNDSISCIRFNTSGTRVATGSFDKHVIVTDASNGKMLAKIYCDSSVHCIDFTPDGDHVVCALWSQTVKLLSIKNKKCMKILRGHEAPVWSCAVFPDGLTIMSGDGDGVIKMWDRNTGECKQTWKDCTDSVAYVLIPKLGNNVLVCYNDMVILRDVKDGRIVRRFIDGHSKKILSCVLSSDELIAFTSSLDNTVKVWDVQTGACLQTMQFNRPVHSLFLSFDSSVIIASLYGNSLRFLERLPGPIVQKIRFDSFPISSPIFNLDQSKILVQTSTIAQFLDRYSGQVVSTIETACKNLYPDLHGEIVSHQALLQQYIQRCVHVALLLLYDPKSIFANRMKLSVWLQPDVFADAVERPDWGFTRRMALTLFKRVMVLDGSGWVPPI